MTTLPSIFLHQSTPNLKSYRASILDDLFSPLDVLFDNAFFPSPLGNVKSNIKPIDEDHYRIILQVPGLTKEEINVEHNKEKNLLIISGNRKETDDDASHFSIQNFTKKYQLQEFHNVSDCKLENGILDVLIERNIPEEKKPVQIQIK